MIHLSLFTNEPLLANGLESALRQAGGFEVLPHCGTLAELKQQVAEDKPDLVLLDLGPQVTFAFLSEMERTADAYVVLWVDSISTVLAFQAIDLGVRGILRKTLPPELHVRCLNRVQSGEVWFERALIESPVPVRRVALTPSEGQLVRLLCQGLKNKEIADYLAEPEGFVKVRLSRLYQKVGVKDRFELALFALKHLSIGQSLGDEAPAAAAGSRPFAAEALRVGFSADSATLVGALAD